MKLHVIVTAFNRPLDLLRLALDFVLQTNGEWVMKIIHDGTPPDGMAKRIKDLHDARIEFDYTERVNGFWGHVNRRMVLQEVCGSPEDYVLITNDDNQYVKVFWELFAAECGKDVGMVLCDMLHNYKWCGYYSVASTQVAVGRIDMGAFIVRLDVAQAVGFNHTVEVADGLYAVECAKECARRGLRVVKIGKPLFIHN